MLSLLPSLVVAQISTAPFPQAQQYVMNHQEIRTLPGKLNDVLVFNSNSPEVVQSDGILLSTFPVTGKTFPYAHLNQPLQGRFDFFSHHIARPAGGEQRTLYQGILVHNPSSRWVTLRIMQAASYLTSTDAPFVQLASIVEDPRGQIFSGPGSRLMGDILRGFSQRQFPSQIAIAPGQTRTLAVLPILPSSARSTFMRLESDGPLYMANLAKFAIPEVRPAAEKNDKPPTITYREPTLDDWRSLLTRGRLAEPRDLTPTPPQINDPQRIIYGRVAGISVGSEWIARVADRPGIPYLSVPEKGKAFSYPISTVATGTYGTKQVQSAPMLVRYPDTALQAHGNYAVHYNLTFPLVNNSTQRQTVTLSLQTPIKQDNYADRLYFFNSPRGQVFFRGTVRASYKDDRGNPQVRYFHIVQRQGQQGEPFIALNLAPGENREVNLDLLYPPDATPPQVITVRTEELFFGRNF
jgi:hypothetical protein